jgi:hypothetical protein
MQKKAYLILFLVVALIVSAWTVSPAVSAAARLRPELNTSECKRGADALTGYLATIPGVTDQIMQICDFNIRMNDLDAELAPLDSQFIQYSIASNLLEIQSLQYALERAQNEELRGLLLTMLMMRTHDMELALQVAQRYNLNTEPDFTNVLVYPGTPNYDLGMRNVDLMAQFLNPLMSAGAPFPTVTATPIATMTGTLTTETPTMIPTLDTMTPSVTSTVDLTGTTTVIATQDTATPTASPTETMTDTPTATFTALPTDTPTMTDTQTLTPEFTSTVDLTGTTTVIPTLPTLDTTTPTITPTIPVSPANFDMVALHIIEEEHVMQVETALAAERLVQNNEIRAFAKHTADMTQLHLLLISDLKHRLFDLYAPPTPDFQRNYQAPRLFMP